MASRSGTVPLKEKIKKFWQSEEQIPAAVREIVSVLITVGVIVAILFLVCGTWPAIVTIESESMVPNMNVGDLVLVVAADRLGPLQSMAEGNESGYEKFGMPGDVIIYRPNDNRDLHPIIHRALFWVDAGPTNITYREMDKTTGKIGVKQYISPHGGYITKGDNNPVIDQTGFGSNYRGLGSPIQPVKPEWIVGKAVFKVPLVGYLPLNIVPVIIIVVLFMILHELYLRHRNKSENPSSRKK
jgi:signal peptidase